MESTTMAKSRKESFDGHFPLLDCSASTTSVDDLQVLDFAAAAAAAATSSTSKAGDSNSEDAVSTALRAAAAFELTSKDDDKKSNKALEHLNALGLPNCESSSLSGGGVESSSIFDGKVQPVDKNKPQQAGPMREGVQSKQAPGGEDDNDNDSRASSSATLDIVSQRLLLDALMMSSSGPSTGPTGGGRRDRFESWGGMSDLSVGGITSHPSGGSLSGDHNMIENVAAALAASALQHTGIIDDVTAAAAEIDLPNFSMGSGCSLDLASGSLSGRIENSSVTSSAKVCGKNVKGDTTLSSSSAGGGEGGSKKPQASSKKVVPDSIPSKIAVGTTASTSHRKSSLGSLSESSLVSALPTPVMGEQPKTPIPEELQVAVDEATTTVTSDLADILGDSTASSLPSNPGMANTKEETAILEKEDLAATAAEAVAEVEKSSFSIASGQLEETSVPGIANLDDPVKVPTLAQGGPEHNQAVASKKDEVRPNSVTSTPSVVAAPLPPPIRVDYDAVAAAVSAAAAVTGTLDLSTITVMTVPSPDVSVSAYAVSSAKQPTLTGTGNAKSEKLTTVPKAEKEQSVLVSEESKKALSSTSAASTAQKSTVIMTPVNKPALLSAKEQVPSAVDKERDWEAIRARARAAAGYVPPPNTPSTPATKRRDPLKTPSNIGVNGSSSVGSTGSYPPLKKRPKRPFPDKLGSSVMLPSGSGTFVSATPPFGAGNSKIPTSAGKPPIPCVSAPHLPKGSFPYATPIGKKRPYICPPNASTAYSTPIDRPGAPGYSRLGGTPSSIVSTPSSAKSSSGGGGGQSNQKWEEMFQCLETFIAEQQAEAKKKGGDGEDWDGNVPTTYKTKDGKALGRWINNQRSAHQKGSLKREREIRLKSTGLKWCVLATNSWSDMMEELRIYVRDKTKDGDPWDGNVPTNYRIRNNTAADGTEIDEEKNLGRWINRQRSLFQAGKLKKERQLELEKIGLKWSVLSTSSWQSMYEALCDYAKKKRDADENNYWDGNVPANYRTDCNPPKSLGRWVNRQRSAYAKKKLKGEFIEKLESVGLKWSVHERKSGSKASTETRGSQNVSDVEDGSDDDDINENDANRKSTKERDLDKKQTTPPHPISESSTETTTGGKEKATDDSCPGASAPNALSSVADGDVIGESSDKSKEIKEKSTISSRVDKENSNGSLSEKSGSVAVKTKS